jgi:hypothetical protein
MYGVGNPVFVYDSNRQKKKILRLIRPLCGAYRYLKKKKTKAKY